MTQMAPLRSTDSDASKRDPRAPAFSFASQLVVLSEARDGAAEALRALRNYMMVHHFELGRRAVAVCAASEGVGCAFVASNLAIALSQIGLKTLLIDGNMRQPSLEQYIRPAAPTKGLVQCLSSAEANLHEFIEPDVLPNLSVLFAGEAGANAQELLAGPRFETLMELCLRDYEATIVDTPPANVCADARRISTVVGYSLIVARTNKSFVNDVKTLSTQLREDHVRVIGSVLNED